jgi:hypothetical protein
MSLKGFIIFLLVLIAIVLVILSLVLLTSAAIYGAWILPLLCVGCLLVFFFGVSFINKDR